MLLEASRKDFLEGLAVDFGEEDFDCEGKVDDFACMPNNLRTSGTSALPAGVLTRFIL